METAAGVEAVFSYANIHDGQVVSKFTNAPFAAGLATFDLGLPEDVLTMGKIEATSMRDNFVAPEAAFGGMRLKGGGLCTSGFSIDERYGTRRGIITAAHCTGMNQIVHPGHATHTTTHKQDHEGAYGDIEWHTTNVNTPPRFYASSGTVRNVLDVDGYPSKNESVCGYGRSSNRVACTRIEKTEAKRTGENGKSVWLTVTYEDDNPLIGGDSGGPWYHGNVAYGIHFGNCGGKEAFTGAWNVYPAFGFDIDDVD